MILFLRVITYTRHYFVKTLCIETFFRIFDQNYFLG